MTTKYVISGDLSRFEPYCELWRIVSWVDQLRRSQHGLAFDLECELIGIEHGIEWAKSAAGICGFSIAYDLPANLWIVELGADPCGALDGPVTEKDRLLNRAIAKACIVAVKKMAEKESQ